MSDTNEKTEMGEIALKSGNSVTEKEEASEKNYLEGLKKYQSQGVNILIDGRELPEQDWKVLFELREDDLFYMADYVPDEETGRIREIRFDRVYNR